MERARIGVAGLDRGTVSHVSSIDGVVNHTAFSEVMAKLPNATFEDATDVVGYVRYVKGEEELTYVRRSAEVAVAGLEELIKSAGPGVDAAVLYASVMERLLEWRSEYYPLSLSIDGLGNAKPKIYNNPPVGRRLENNALITNEVNAILGAQLTQVCQPILLGTVPDAFEPIIDAQREIYAAGLHQLKPGNTFQNVIEAAAQVGAKRNLRVIPQLHGCGYGDDGPLLTSASASKHVADLRIEKGNAFVWKPSVASEHGTIQFCWGGPVIVTENGAEALFKKKPGMVSIAEG
jgi:Xaa-Pro aminopeptidase